MFDRQARNSLAEAARHYLTGLSSNFEFDDRMFRIRSRDLAVSAIRSQFWLIYDDLRKHKHEKEWRISDQQREIVLRAILFLKSDIEYTWPVVPAWYLAIRPFIWALTLGYGVRVLDRKYELQDPANVWPFRHRDEINAAKNRPRYLAAVV